MDKLLLSWARILDSTLINDSPVASALTGLLSSLGVADSLPRTILYSLNARDNEILASLMGSFQGDGIPGKIQLGAAWWFNDTKDGMVSQMKSLGEFWFAWPICRHADRFQKLLVLHKTRLLPQNPLQHVRRMGRSGRIPE